MSEKIKLNKDFFALVSKEDFDFLIKSKWWVSSQGYAEGSEMIDGKRKKVLMHRIITGAPKGMTVDHINGNKLDNRRENLRIATYQENNMNVFKNKNKKGYKGVYWCKQIKKWKATIGFNKKVIHIGVFSDQEEASIAYNEKAKELFGEFFNPSVGDSCV